MRCEQAIFTSLNRQGREGYHLVARSAGLAEDEAQVIASRSPSHDALVVDDFNAVGVSFYELGSGRFALARTCAGPPEYSGRGGPQLYTHALILDAEAVARWDGHMVALLRAAMALGYFRYRADPPASPEPVELPTLSLRREPSYWRDRARELGLESPRRWLEPLASGTPVRLAYPGDRLALAECLVALLPPSARSSASFSTSLKASKSRPFLLVLEGEP